jgi:hypothetical protein
VSFLIKVEQRHIDAGTRGDCGVCPVSLAIYDCLPGSCSVAVDWHWISFCIGINYNIRYYSFKTPDFVSKNISRFDIEGIMEPFEFILEERN